MSKNRRKIKLFIIHHYQHTHYQGSRQKQARKKWARIQNIENAREVVIGTVIEIENEIEKMIGTGWR